VSILLHANLLLSRLLPGFIPTAQFLELLLRTRPAPSDC
jgi:hypothetical protein